MKTRNIIIFNLEKRKSPLIILNLQPGAFFQGTEERVRKSRGKRAISVPAIKGLLYIHQEKKSYLNKNSLK